MLCFAHLPHGNMRAIDLRHISDHDTAAMVQHVQMARLTGSYVTGHSKDGFPLAIAAHLVETIEQVSLERWEAEGV